MNEKIKEIRRATREPEPDRNSLVLHCGETVPESGIYEAIHKRGQEEGHRVSVVVLRGDKVQPCASCGEEVSLRLVRSAPHISEDADFCHRRE